MQASIIEKTMTESKIEIRISDQIGKLRTEKQNIKQGRILRDQQYTERRLIEYKEAIDREYNCFENIRAELEIKDEMQMQQHREILKIKHQGQHVRTLASCANMIDEILLLAFKVADYRLIGEKKEVPLKTMRGWKFLFENNVSLYEKQTLELSKGTLPHAPAVSTISDTNLTESTRVLDHKEFVDYIDHQGNWESVNGCEKNLIFAGIIDEIMFVPPVLPVAVERMFSSSVTIALVGKRFSGKSVIAQKLSEKYGLPVINVDQLIKNTVE